MLNITTGRLLKIRGVTADILKEKALVAVYDFENNEITTMLYKEDFEE
jgi:hypothetical protein